MNQNFLWLPESDLFLNCDRIIAVSRGYDNMDNCILTVYLDIPKGLRVESGLFLEDGRVLVAVREDADAIESWLIQKAKLADIDSFDSD